MRCDATFAKDEDDISESHICVGSTIRHGHPGKIAACSLFACLVLGSVEISLEDLCIDTCGRYSSSMQGYFDPFAFPVELRAEEKDLTMLGPGEGAGYWGLQRGPE